MSMKGVGRLTTMFENGECHNASQQDSKPDTTADFDLAIGLNTNREYGQNHTMTLEERAKFTQTMREEQACLLASFKQSQRDAQLAIQIAEEDARDHRQQNTMDEATRRLVEQLRFEDEMARNVHMFNY